MFDMPTTLQPSQLNREESNMAQSNNVLEVAIAPVVDHAAIEEGGR